jgi:RNA polymerase subunit RPABC4/transcription elongation factor Spt4
MGTGLPALREQCDNCIYEVDPLKCPVCGGTMKVISFITIVL